MGKSNCPQVLQRVPLGKGNAIRLTKDVWRRLEGKCEAVLLDEVDGEIRLSGRIGREPIPVVKGRIALPDSACQHLGVAAKDMLVLIQREDAVAIKRFVSVACVGSIAALVDEETPTAVRRTLTQRRRPEELLPELEAEVADLALRHSPADFLAGRSSFDAWLARREWGICDADDGALQDELIRHRLTGQMPDGSWGGDLVVTARMLWELAELGLRRGHAGVDLAAHWLVSRPESPHNPGMFFLTDALAEKQMQVVASRNHGKGGRFRDRKRREIAQAAQGDDHAPDPCAPRLMWPTAYAVEALIATGWEDHPRTQRALDSLEPGGWCECGYQHGCGHQRDRHPLTAERIRDCEAEFRARFVNGGEECRENYDSTGPRRIAMAVEGNRTRYELSLPLHIQPCEAIAVKCLHQTARAPLRELCETYLWRFAAVQQGIGGSFSGNSRHVDHFFMLSVFARYDHSASRIAIQRALRLLIESQNPDGSWGSEGKEDSATLIALRALKSIGWLATR
jgi:hypothetical protein